MPRQDEVMPLAEFPAAHRARIAEFVALPHPPSRYILLGHPGDPYPLAQIESRAWWEWHWARGRDPEKVRTRIPTRVRRAVIERDGYICQLCGGEIEPSDVHLDHIVPWSHGGPDTVKNLRVTHSLCNIKRGAPVEDPQHPSGVLVE